MRKNRFWCIHPLLLFMEKMLISEYNKLNVDERAGRKARQYMRAYEETGTYTTSMENCMYDLDPEAPDYKDRLIALVGEFRPMDQVLEALLLWKGYSGDRDSLEEKTAFTRQVFQAAGVPVPRNLKGFLAGTARFDRDKKTPFQFCFAFGLSMEEAETFFRRCCMGRGFDDHSMQDVVYSFAIRKKLSYQQAEQLLERLSKLEQNRLPMDEEICYTETIRKDLAAIEGQEDLFNYLKKNEKAFAYNNARAIKKIQELWDKLTIIPDGLLSKEVSDLYCEAEDRQKLKKKWSEEGALKQILGLNDRIILRHFTNKRSLKEILKDNRLLHPLAADCFPNRNAIRLILEGRHVSYESVRKLLILLLFYQYWMEKALMKHAANRSSGEHEDLIWSARGGDGERCRNHMDRHLMEAGYPSLYFGNPYDWLFLFAMIDEEPLLALRYFMKELYLEIMEDNRE